MADFSKNLVSDAYYDRVDANNQQSARNMQTLSSMMGVQNQQRQMRLQDAEFAQKQQQQAIINAYASKLPPDQQAEFKVDPKGFMEARRNENDIKTYLQGQVQQPKATLSGFEPLAATQQGSPFAGMQGMAGNAEQMIQDVATRQDIPPEEKQAIINQIKQQQNSGGQQQANSGAMVSRNPIINADIKFRQTQQDKQDALASNQALQREFEQGRNSRATEAQAGADNRADKRITAMQQLGSGDLLPNDVADYTARQYLAGDRMAISGLARSKAAMRQVREKIAEIGIAEGISPTELTQRMGEFSGMVASQRVIGSQMGNIQLAANEAVEMIAVTESYIGKINPTEYPSLNAIKNAVDRGTGGEEIVGLNTSLNSLVNVYARAINPKGVATVSDKEHAREIIDKALSTGQMEEALSVMRQEMNAALKSGPRAIEQIRKARGLDEKGGVGKQVDQPQIMSKNSIQEAAKKYGKTVAQVTKDLRARGIKVEGE